MAESKVDVKCRNCGAAIQGAYCFECGQSVVDARSPFLEAVGIFLQQTFGTDARLWSTLRKLMFQPGVLTEEFIEGKQRRSLHPMRLFLIASVLAMLTPDISLGEEFVPPESWSEVAPAGAGFFERLSIGQDRVMALARGKTPQEMTPFGIEINKAYLVWCLLLTQIGLVFVLALLAWKRLLYDHLIFVLHFASFAYFSDMLFRLTSVRAWAGGIPMLIVQAGYCMLAFRRVYAIRAPRVPGLVRWLFDLGRGFLVYAAMAVILKYVMFLASAYHVMPAAS